MTFRIFTAMTLAVTLSLTGVAAFAQNAPPGVMATPQLAAPLAVAPSSVTTSRGPGLVTGAPGSPQTIMVPGSPVPGTLSNNGNGSSILVVPGSVPQVVLTPR